MKSSRPVAFFLVVVVSLVIGVAGYFLDVVSIKAGEEFVDRLFEDERNADISHPQVLTCNSFQLRYPKNWKIDEDDEVYDPNQNFSIESPGSSFVMFAIGTLEMSPEERLKFYVREYEKMGAVIIERFERYGRYSGKGAILTRKNMGIQTTIKLFAFSYKGFNAIITQFWPDEDFMMVHTGFGLIENTFSVTTIDERTAMEKP